MKLLGMIGGMSWESTIEYYDKLNKILNQKLGDWNTAKLLLYSVNFQEVLPLQNKNRWNEIAAIMVDISKNLEKSGCEGIMICSNTMHKIAAMVESNLDIPLINIIDETAKAIKSKDFSTIGLLGTKFTMEGGFYTDRLIDKHGLNVYLPTSVERMTIHNAIYNELAIGEFLDTTKQAFLEIIDNLKSQGTQGIILGCTEIPLLIKQKDVNIPLFDTLDIHLKAAVDFILS